MLTRKLWMCLQRANLYQGRFGFSTVAKALDSISTLERDNGKLLSLVNNKVAERNELLSKIQSGSEAGGKCTWSSVLLIQIDSYLFYMTV